MSDDRQVSKFDRAVGMLEGLTGVTKTAAASKVVTTPLIGATATYIVQTYRMRDEHDETNGSRDTVFLQYLAEGEQYRIVIPHEVAAIIARQRDALTTKSRKRAGKAVAEARKARGEKPAFLKVAK